MSIHVCKCEYNGREEFHLRYPGMSLSEAQHIADLINAGALDKFLHSAAPYIEHVTFQQAWPNTGE